MEQNSKIKSLDELAKITEKLREEGKTVVHCHGVFDLLHIGHIRYFEQASKFGDVIIVTLTPDEFVDKGAHRPAFNQQLRAEGLAALDVIDYVAINKWPRADEALRLLKPDCYVKGSEFKNLQSDPTGKIALEAKVVEEIGAKLVFTEDIVFSSTNLINKHLSQFNDEVDEHLQLMRKRYELKDIISVLEQMKELKVLIIGDTILDEYQYANAIGKSSKDPVLAMLYNSHDLFAGGVLAVANHLANFAGEVELVTVLGENDPNNEFIRKSLNPSIKTHFAYQKNAPTILKRRFVDGYSLNKLLEIYHMDDSGLSEDRDRKLREYVDSVIRNYDLVVVADFGHGMISDEMIWTLSDGAKYMCLNTQANAGNRGFHTITKYPNTDYACIAEHELRLETRDLTASPRLLVEKVAKRMASRQFVVTLGRKGCAVWDDSPGYVVLPSLADRVVDRVGAGDAFFSVTSLASVLNCPSEILGFLGNVVGGLAVKIVGNEKSIDRMGVEKYLTSLMK